MMAPVTAPAMAPAIVSCAGRRRGHHLDLLVGCEMRIAGVVVRLRHGPVMAFITVAVELLVALSVRGIDVICPMSARELSAAARIQPAAWRRDRADAQAHGRRSVIKNIAASERNIQSLLGSITQRGKIG